MADIYGLYDANGNLRYIGKANDPHKRLKGHMLDARTRKTPLYDWINKHGVVPEMRVLEADCADWKQSERRLIAEARARGDNLLNVADGGDEPHCSDDVRSANGHKLVALIREDAHFRKLWHMKRQMRQAMKQGYLSNKSRAKLRDAAGKRPDLFGAFANIPDRVEGADGRGVIRVGKHLVSA